MHKSRNINRTFLNNSRKEAFSTRPFLVYDITPRQARIIDAITGLDPKKSKNQKIFSMSWRIVFASFLMFYFISGLTPWQYVKTGFGADGDEIKQTVSYYSGECGSTGLTATSGSSWLNPEKASGRPDVGTEGEMINFNEENSTAYIGGINGLICAQFSKPASSLETTAEQAQPAQLENLEAENGQEEQSEDETVFENSEAIQDAEETAENSSDDISEENLVETKNGINDNDNPDESDPETFENSISETNESEAEENSESASEITGDNEQSAYVAEDLNSDEDTEIIENETVPGDIEVIEPQEIVTEVEAADEPLSVGVIRNVLAKTYQKTISYFKNSLKTAFADEDDSNSADDEGEFRSARIRLSLAIAKKMQTGEESENSNNSANQEAGNEIEATVDAGEDAEENSEENISGDSQSPISEDSADDGTFQEVTVEQAIEEVEIEENLNPSEQVEIMETTEDTSAEVSKAGSDNFWTKIFSPRSASAESGSEEPIFKIWYSVAEDPISGPVWQEAGNVSGLPLSNALNGGYLTIDAPFIKSREEINQIKLKIESLSEIEPDFVAYIDSIWVEADYGNKKEEDALRKARWEKMLELLSDKTVFKLNERGELKFSYQKNDKKIWESLGLADYWKDVDIRIRIKDPANSEMRLPITTIFENNGEFTLKLPRTGRSFKPGRYMIEFSIEDSSGETTETITLERGFEWGVLAMNFNKSVYEPRELSHIQMAVLDEQGNTICDAGLRAEMTTPGGEVIILDTENGLISRNPECGPNNVIKNSDYRAYHIFGDETGVYQIKLIADTRNGQKEIEEKIEIKNSLPLNIERLGPTRIYPKAEYLMKLRVRAERDFRGEFREVVPGDFKITNYKLEISSNKLQDTSSKIQINANTNFTINNIDDGQELVWSDIEIKSGDELVFEYTFKAPEVSPELFLLGPAQLRQDFNGKASEGDFIEERQWQIASDSLRQRAKTVTFFAGKYTGSGMVGLNSNTDQSLSAFNWNLAEKGVNIKNAYVVLEAQYEAYNTTATAYTSSNVTFDACSGACTANAWSGSGRASTSDSSVLSYDETESNMIRLLLDATPESELASYTGNGANINSQVGFRFNTNIVNNSIAYANAKLVVTYTYDADSENITNTVYYPLDSADTPNGSKSTMTSNNCVFGIDCPVFNYNMEIPEFNTAASSTVRQSQWFTIQNNLYSSANAIDVTVNVQIEGNTANTDTYIHESALQDASNMMPVIFTGVPGFSENASQNIAIQQASAGTKLYYLQGGEVAETYIASSSAATSTRTVSFPIGVVTVGNLTTQQNAFVDVYFPENNTSAGKVKIKKAWLRINSSNRTANAGYYVDTATKVGNNAASAAKRYYYRPGGVITNPVLNFNHIIPSADYTELESASTSTPKRVTLYTTSNINTLGGVSAELMITYTYENESAGYLSSLSMFGMQAMVNGNATTTYASSSPLIFPESVGTTTVYAAGLQASYLSSASTGVMANGNLLMDARLSEGTPTCTNAYNGRGDAQNAFNEFINAATITNINNKIYNICISNNGFGAANTGAKMNAFLNYTYGWTNQAPTSTISSLSARRDASGLVDLSFKINDPDGDDCRVKVMYATSTACSFADPADPTIDSSVTASYGTPVVDNSHSYQIGTTTGWVAAYASDNTVNAVWNAASDLPQGDGDYCVGIIANDLASDQTIIATATVRIDNIAPTAPGAFTLSSKRATSAILAFGATSTETNFSEYKIFYKIHDGADPDESDWEISSTTDINLGNKLFNGAATTSIANLIPGTQYSFALWVYDEYGYAASSSRFDLTTNNYPLGMFNAGGTSAQLTDGSGIVKAYIEADDPDNDDALRAKIEYDAGEDCAFDASGDPSLDENPDNTHSDFGSVWIENDNEYQIGAADHWIWTSPGANKINFLWPSKNDLPDADGYYCLRLTVFDGMDKQATSATTTLIIDNVEPDAPGALEKESSTRNNITLRFGATSTDSHFSHYKIYYKAGTEGVTESDTELVDSDLNNILFNGTATATTPSNLLPNTDYVFKIWAYDQYGNSSSSAETVIKTDATIKNESLVFVNPIMENLGIADGYAKQTFRAVVSEVNGYAAITNVTLRLAGQDDSLSPFEDLAFRWDRLTGNFTEVGSDALGAAAVSASSSSVCAGTSCTIDFRIVFNYKFRASSTDYAAELYSVNEAAVSDTDVYDNFYKLRLVNVKQIHYRWRNDDGGE